MMDARKPLFFGICILMLVLTIHSAIAVAPVMQTCSFNFVTDIAGSANATDADSANVSYNYQVYVDGVLSQIPSGGWVNSSALVAGLVDVGLNSNPTVVYNLGGNGKWNLLSGKTTAGADGYTWNGTAWASNSTIVSGLSGADIQVHLTIAYNFNNNGKWTAIGGNSGGTFRGYTWSGSTWTEDSSVVNGLGDIGSISSPQLLYNFKGDGKWTLISGEYNGLFFGFVWSGSTWNSDSSVISGLTDVGYFSHPSVLIDYDGPWSMIVGRNDGKFTGFKWNGSTWGPYPALVNGLGDTGDYSFPSVFYNFSGAGEWSVISGDYYGVFFGFNQSLATTGSTGFLPAGSDTSVFGSSWAKAVAAGKKYILSCQATDGVDTSSWLNSSEVDVTLLNSCRSLAASRSYTLTQNIVGSATNCLFINATNVTLDGAGFTVTSSGGNIVHASSIATNVYIKNLTVNGSGSTTTSLVTLDAGGTIEDVTVKFGASNFQSQTGISPGANSYLNRVTVQDSGSAGGQYTQYLVSPQSSDVTINNSVFNWTNLNGFAILAGTGKANIHVFNSKFYPYQAVSVSSNAVFRIEDNAGANSFWSINNSVYSANKNVYVVYDSSQNGKVSNVFEGNYFEGSFYMTSMGGTSTFVNNIVLGSFYIDQGSWSTPTGITVYNNYFQVLPTGRVRSEGNMVVTPYVTPQNGTRIAGITGPEIGGNYYNGFNCTDADNNGFCDGNYTYTSQYTGMYDLYPLSNNTWWPIYGCSPSVATANNTASRGGVSVALNSRCGDERTYVAVGSKSNIVVNQTSGLSFTGNASSGNVTVFVGATNASSNMRTNWVNLTERVSNLGTVQSFTADKSIYWLVNEQPSVVVNMSSLDGYSVTPSAIVSVKNGSNVIASKNMTRGSTTLEICGGCGTGSYWNAAWIGQTFNATATRLAGFFSYYSGGTYADLYLGSDRSTLLYSGLVSGLSSVKLTVGQTYLIGYSSGNNPVYGYTGDTYPGCLFSEYAGGLRCDLDLRVNISFYQDSYSAAFTGLSTSYENATFVVVVNDTLFSESAAISSLAGGTSLAVEAQGLSTVNQVGSLFITDVAGSMLKNISVFSGQSTDPTYATLYKFVSVYSGDKEDVQFMKRVPIVNDVAVFDEMLPVAGRYYVAADSVGSAYSYARYAGGGFPIVTSYLTLERGISCSVGGYGACTRMSWQFGNYMYVIKTINVAKPDLFMLDALTLPTSVSPSGTTLYTTSIPVSWGASANGLGSVVYDVVKNINGTNETVQIGVGGANTTFSETRETANGLVYVRARDSYVNTTYVQNAAPFQIVLNPDIQNQLCPGTIDPNADDLPAVATGSVTFSVFAPLGFSSPTVVARVTKNSVTSTASCSYVAIDGQHRNYTCTAPVRYFYESGAWSVYVNYTDGAKSVQETSSGICTVGQTMSVVRNVDSVTFPSASPGVANAPANTPIVMRNAGNVPVDLSMHGYDLVGRQSPGIIISAGSFKAGSSLGNAVPMVNNNDTDLSMTLDPGEGSSVNVYMWLSLPVNILLQDYYSPIAWQIVSTQ